MHLADVEYRDGAGTDLVLPTTLCYSTGDPCLELHRGDARDGLGAQRALEPAPHRLLERRLRRRDRVAHRRPAARCSSAGAPAPTHRSRSRTTGSTTSASGSSSSTPTMRDAMAVLVRSPTRRGLTLMLQVRVHGPGDVRVDDVAEPDPGPRRRRRARRRVWRSAAATSRTSDSAASPGPAGTPMCLGHEMAGTVDWVGADVDHGARRRPRRGAPRRTTSSAASATARPRAASRRCCWSPTPTAAGCTRCPTTCPSTSPRSPSRSPSACTPPTRPTCNRATACACFGCGPIGLAAIATLVDRGARPGRRRRPQPDPARPRPSASARRPPSTRRPTDVWDELGRPPRHRAVHVRADSGDRRVHRGLRRRPRSSAT